MSLRIQSRRRVGHSPGKQNLSVGHSAPSGPVLSRRPSPLVETEERELRTPYKRRGGSGARGHPAVRASAGRLLSDGGGRCTGRSRATHGLLFVPGIPPLSHARFRPSVLHPIGRSRRGGNGQSRRRRFAHRNPRTSYRRTPAAARLWECRLSPPTEQLPKADLAGWIIPRKACFSGASNPHRKNRGPVVMLVRAPFPGAPTFAGRPAAATLRRRAP